MSARTPPVLKIVGLVVFASTLFTRAVDPVIPQIALDFAIDVKTAALLSTAYTFPYALVQPVLGTLGDFFGKTRLMNAALPIFAEIRQTLGVPVLTDVHDATQCARVAEVVDVLQIPAFLCRQTDLLIAAAETGRVINVKKGQFLAPWDMANVVAKITGAGNRNVLVTERGASFGYNTLVSDFRALPILKRSTGAPVIFDATHSVQQPGGQGTSSGGEREFVPVLARAAVAVGVAGVFIETHQDPDKAPSDGPNMVPLKEMDGLLRTLVAFDRLAKN